MNDCGQLLAKRLHTTQRLVSLAKALVRTILNEKETVEKCTIAEKIELRPKVEEPMLTVEES